MKIVAFLQNPWFKPGTPERTIQRYNEDQRFHRAVLALSPSGKRLKLAFGKGLYDRIVWENASPLPAFSSAEIKHHDLSHMIRVLGREKPALIIAFGAEARKGARNLGGHYNGVYMLIEAKHPSPIGARFDELLQVADLVRGLIASSKALNL